MLTLVYGHKNVIRDKCKGSKGTRQSMCIS